MSAFITVSNSCSVDVGSLAVFCCMIVTDMTVNESIQRVISPDPYVYSSADFRSSLADEDRSCGYQMASVSFDS